MSDKVTHRSSKPDMLKFAAEELGVQLDPELDRSEIWAEIKKLDESLAKSDEAAPVGESNQPEEKSGSKRPERVLILIHPLPGSDDPEIEPETHIVLGVNGVNYQLEINKEIPVKYSVYDVLKNAKQKRYHRKKDPRTGQVSMVEQVVPRYPFTFIRNVE